MQPNTLEIEGDNRHLCKERGFLAVYSHGESLGRLPLDDLGVVLVAGHGITYSNDLLVALAERCVPLVLCNRRMLPVGFFWSMEGHHLQGGRLRSQAAASLPLRKRLWQQIVQAKIALQAQVVESQAGNSGHLLKMAQQVRSGDPDNLEARAARLYWRQAFGPDFRRNRDLPGVNGLLNYAYTILRSATARAVMLAGLHPGFGIHHHNARNSMPLVDDLMEPYRPCADLAVLSLAVQGRQDLDKDSKEALCQVPLLEVRQGDEIRVVAESLRACAASLSAALQDKQKELTLPEALITKADNRDIP